MQDHEPSHSLALDCGPHPGASSDASQHDTSHTARKRDRFVLEAMARRFGRAAIGRKDISVLDLGCGPGNLADALGRAGVRTLHGVDLDPPAIGEAKRRCAGFGHTFEVADVEAFIPERPYDVIVISEVLAYLSRPERLLDRVRSWLNPVGLVVATLPNGYGPWCAARARVEKHQGIEPWSLASAMGIHRLGYAGLLEIVKAAGFCATRVGNSSFLSAVYPFSVSRYRPEKYGWIERLDVAVADWIPRRWSSGWFLALVPDPSLVRVQAPQLSLAKARLRAAFLEAHA